MRENLTEQVIFRLTSKERAKLNASAKKKGMRVSEFLRAYIRRLK